MSNAKSRNLTRENIIGLLTEAEVAKVSRIEGDPRLVEGDHYVDLENPGSGVHQMQGTSNTSPRRALPQSAVSDATWEKIVKLVGRPD